jgi:hypothetical protein
MKVNFFVIALFFGFVFSVFGQNISDFTYTVKDNKITITGYSSSGSKAVTIPASIYGWPVVAIGDEAFSNKDITSVIIPNSVIIIGRNAFASGKFNRYSSSSIDSYSNGKLTSVTIPNSVISIADGAFAGNKLTGVTIPNSVTSIGNRAFFNNQLTSVIIPNSVTSIGDGAFAGNKLTGVVIPNSVAAFYSGAFDTNVEIKRP